MPMPNWLPMSINNYSYIEYNYTHIMLRKINLLYIWKTLMKNFIGNVLLDEIVTRGPVPKLLEGTNKSSNQLRPVEGELY